MQTRGVRGQKISKNANVICERPLIWTLASLSNFDLIKTNHVFTISVPDFDEEIPVPSTRRKKNSNQKLFERYYQSQGNNVDNNDSTDEYSEENEENLLA